MSLNSLTLEILLLIVGDLGQLRSDIAPRGDNRVGYGTTLQKAADNGHDALVQLLIEDGAEIKVDNGALGGTALQRAAKHGHEAVMRLLRDINGDLVEYRCMQQLLEMVGLKGVSTGVTDEHGRILLSGVMRKS